MSRSTLTSAWLSALVLLTMAGASHSQDAKPQTALALAGEGVQIYTCQVQSGTASWVLKAPDATLRDSHGKTVGHHFGGPSWKLDDGSTVVGEALSVSPAPQAGAIPWIVLHVKSHDGQGGLESVDYVVRTQTQGGVAPQTGCDAAHAGVELRVPYKATYLFFRR
ncbi:DUF3455 domain-containing protein [Dyella sp.]|uniref:DUF3455 domain-containing protein n=1 Tax=Dyella sp. TaxID=1869338 RepID=UPI002ED1A6CD